MAYSQGYDLLTQQVAVEVFGSNSALAQVFYRMMRQESGFDSDVVEGRRASSAGAQGIAQFMPATAREQGVDPMNPEQALRGAAKYLQKLIAYFGGQVAKGVAAYNAGAGRVENAVAAGGQNWTASLPGETQQYLAIVQPGGEMMPNGTLETGGVPRPQGPYTGAAGQAGGLGTIQGTTASSADFAQWLLDHGFGGYVYKAEDGTLMIHTNPPASVVNAFLESEADTGVSDLDRRATEAGIAIDEANARSIIAWDEGKTYEQGRQRILDKIDQEHWTADQAIDEFNAWMTATQEATHRGETVYGEQMSRAAMTTPTEYYPGTEPGGAREQFAEKYGVPYTSSPGVPIETLPNPEQMYDRWHQNMGISQQAPPTQGGWSGQGQGMNAAQAFLQRMNLRSAPQGAGF